MYEISQTPDPKWISKVGQYTLEHRQGKARRLRELGARRRGRHRIQAMPDSPEDDGRPRYTALPDSRVLEESRWYNDRARGQEERPRRVLACGSVVIVVTCCQCGASVERINGCGIGLWCGHCRLVLAAAKRSAWRAARDSVVNEARTRGLLSPNRPGGRWSEKFMTLTVPHRATDTIARRIYLVVEAWCRLLRRLNKCWRARDVRNAEWFRVLEWVPATDENDGSGHPHMHLWLFCPYLDQDEIQRWWREALLGAGCPPDDAMRAIIPDIREVYGKSAELELVKYLVKDWGSDGRLDPAIFAELYRALDGRRLTQASRNFMARAKRVERACACCGSSLPKRVTKKRQLVQVVPDGAGLDSAAEP